MKIITLKRQVSDVQDNAKEGLCRINGANEKDSGGTWPKKARYGGGERGYPSYKRDDSQGVTFTYGRGLAN